MESNPLKSTQFVPAKNVEKSTLTKVIIDKPIAAPQDGKKKGSYTDDSGFVYPPYELFSDEKITEVFCCEY